MKLLHLEDSESDALLIEDLLRSAWPDCRIIRASTREEYCERLEAGGFELILSDYAIPGFDGLAALALAREKASDRPFIFISGTIGEERAIEALHRGAADYIIKDRPGRLIAAIEQSLARVEERERRLLSEEELRETQERFRQLAEQSRDGFWFAALKPVRMLYVNPAMERIWGLPAGRFRADFAARLAAIHPEDRARVEHAFQAWASGEQLRYEEEYRVLRSNGSMSWVLDSGTPIRDEAGEIVRLSGIARDITERRRSDEELREQAAWLGKARDAIIATDLTYRVVYWNASAERLYGWSAGEAWGRRLEDLGLGYDPAALSAARAALLWAGEWRGDFNLRSRAGEALQVESSWTLVRGVDQQPRSILLIDTDVTETRKMASQLLRADRMDSIGMLAGGVAHDLNNVLAPILMGAELLRMRQTDPADVRMVDSIARSAQHGAAMVRQLLSFARGGEGEKTEVRLPGLLDDVGKLLRQSLPETIDLHLTAEAGLPPLQADATQLKQVLINLCLNARDAMPRGGRLEVRAALVPPPAGSGSRGRRVRVSVADSGTGIPPELLQKIFDPFFTTKGIGKGTGLGLSTVAGIVKQHGGFVQVESAVGLGTTFQLYFPVAEVPVPPPPIVPATPATGRGGRILLIDDDDNLRTVLQQLLRQAGYEVVSAEGGREGLETFQRTGDFSAVMTDLSMPGIDGLEVIARIREQHPTQPILALSGFSSPARRRALEAYVPPVAFLAKPLAIDVLLASLAQTMAAGRASTGG